MAFAAQMPFAHYVRSHQNSRFGGGFRRKRCRLRLPGGLFRPPQDSLLVSPLWDSLSPTSGPHARERVRLYIVYTKYIRT